MGTKSYGDTGSTFQTSFHSATDEHVYIKTDADVTGTSLKIRIVVFYEQVTAPTS
jgi:hypothetical protein